MIFEKWNILGMFCFPSRDAQVLNPRYGMYVWPCAVVLAQYLWTQRDQLRDKTLLEVRSVSSSPPETGRPSDVCLSVLSSAQV